MAGAERHNLKPRARPEGMAARRGVWQVAAYSLPPDHYVLGMGVPRTLAFTWQVCVAGGGDLGRQVFRPHLMAAGMLGGA